MKRKNKDILKGVQVQGLRLKEDDVLVVKYPKWENGTQGDYIRKMKLIHETIQRKVVCNVLTIPGDIELLKIRKDSDEYKQIAESIKLEVADV